MTEKNVTDYLRADRQWHREHRIAHAKQQRELFKDDPIAQGFWDLVIEANTKE